jgi:hypothetical protein
MKGSMFLAAGLSILAFTAVRADDGAQQCTLESLHGTLAYAYEEAASPQPVPPIGFLALPASGSGMESYDGKGHMKYYELYSDGINSYTYTGTGTYTITSNCIATVIYEYQGAQSGNPWTYFVSPDGSGYFWNNNQNQGLIAGGRVVRISKDLLVN